MLELDNPEIFRSVLEHLETGVYLVDRTRRILFWNEGAEKITGYLRQDVVGRFLRDHLLSPNGETNNADSDVTDPLNLVFRDGKSSIADVSILHKDGYRIPIVLRTVPIRNTRGAVIAAAESFDKNLSASERTRRQAVVAELGCLDGVTGVPGKTYMDTRLAETMTLFKERRAPFGILIVEVEQLDHFLKTRGPGIVPTVLRVVGQDIENSLRPADLVGRWSENQFIALMTECRESDVVRVGDRVRKMIGNSEIEWWGDRIRVAVALGGAGVRPDDTVELLLERAGKSLQESIAAGGNRVTVIT